MAEDKQTLNEPPKKKEAYSLMWKTYDLTGKTKAQFIKEHPYATNPIKAISN
jgi:prophage maintenance system killer protein